MKRITWFLVLYFLAWGLRSSGVTSPIHEWFHVKTAEALGGSGYVASWNTAVTYPTNETTLVGAFNTETIVYSFLTVCLIKWWWIAGFTWGMHNATFFRALISNDFNTALLAKSGFEAAYWNRAGWILVRGLVFLVGCMYFIYRMRQEWLQQRS